VIYDLVNSPYIASVIEWLKIAYFNLHLRGRQKVRANLPNWPSVKTFEPARHARWLDQHRQWLGINRDKYAAALIDHIRGGVDVRRVPDWLDGANMQSDNVATLTDALRRLQEAQGVPALQRVHILQGLAASGCYVDLFATVAIALEMQPSGAVQRAAAQIGPEFSKAYVHGAGLAESSMNGFTEFPYYEHFFEEQLRELHGVEDPTPFDEAFEDWLTPDRNPKRLAGNFALALNALRYGTIAGLSLFASAISARLADLASPPFPTDADLAEARIQETVDRWHAEGCPQL
jgi:hypothetical protein